MSLYAQDVATEDVAATCTEVRRHAGVFDLSDQGVMSLVGPDARRFCNGMFTNNIRDLKVGALNSNAMVDDKARIQGQLDLWCVAPESFLALLHGVSPEAFTARYEKYIIFDDVELTDISEELALLSVQGPSAAAVVAAVGLPVPETEGSFLADGERRIGRRARTQAGGFDLLIPRAELDTLRAQLVAAGAVVVGPEAREVLRIEAGQARWPVDMGEKALPHEMRMVERFCNFNKGCYIGQEVINRIDVMGQVTKKLWRLELGADVSPGTEVRHNDAAVGQVTSVAHEGDRVVALALLRKAAWTPGLTVQVGEQTATVVDLPNR